MERPSIVILVGISGCGKTTWCNHYISEATILSMDSIRKEVFNNVSDQSHNKVVARIFNKQLEDEIALKHNIVIDNMNINIRYIDDIVNKSKGYDIIFYLFDNSLDWQNCFNRVKNDNTDRSRTDNVFVSGKPLIQVMSKKYEIVRKEILQKYKNTAKIIICNDNNIAIDFSVVYLTGLFFQSSSLSKHCLSNLFLFRFFRQHYKP